MLQDVRGSGSHSQVQEFTRKRGWTLLTLTLEERNKVLGEFRQVCQLESGIACHFLL